MNGSTQKTFFLVIIIFILSSYSLFTPAISKLDVFVFKLLNNSVSQKNIWSYIWSTLNHKNEKWMNVIIMLSIQIYCLLSDPVNRVNVGKKFVFFWVYLQLVIYMQHVLFQNILSINRLSPSLVLESCKLSQMFNDYDIKDTSISSFPGGHAFVFTSWMLFTNHISHYKIKYYVVLVAIPFITARLFSGAHWFSDVTFSISLAYILYYVTNKTLLTKV